MAENKWTNEQEAAISTRDCNLLVAAAAGSGKTAVLVERIIQKVTDERKPIDIDKLLVVTFTNAAASEMRERIGNAIAKALDFNSDSKQLQRQLALLGKSNITTIHSFCLQVIRKNFHIIDLDPNFRITDNTEEILLKDEALQEVFDERYELAEEGLHIEFLKLVEEYGGSRSDSLLRDIVLSLYQFVMSGPWPEKWLNDAAEAFNVEDNFDFSQSKWGKVILKSIDIELEGLKNLIDGAVDIINRSPGLEPYLENFNADKIVVEELLLSLANDWEKIYNQFNSYSFTRLSSLSKKIQYDKECQDKVKKIRDDIKKKLNDIKSDIFIFRPEYIIETTKRLYPSMKTLAELVIDFDKRYKLKKSERNLLDFNDLEHLCLKILTSVDSEGVIIPSDKALFYRDYFEEILVDEYQDSNFVQEVILNMISRKLSDNPNIFMVGDVKQSIYRFRQAQPQLFLEKYENYSSEKGEKNRKITLYKNFRSRIEIINSVNYIFKMIMSRNIGELEYTDEEALKLGANYKAVEDDSAIVAGPTEIHLIEKAKRKAEETEVEEKEENNVGEEVLEDEEDINSIQLEARIIGNRIKKLINTDEEGKEFKVFDKTINGYRKAQFRDIVILLRATTNFAPVFIEELGAMDVPVYADTGTGYFETTEIKTMMSLLQIIDNPLQDIPLLAVLRSPIFAFDAEELINIRIIDKEAEIYENIKNLSEKVNEESSSEEISEDYVKVIKKCADFVHKLKEWRERALHTPIDELIWYLYSDTGYYGYVGAMPAGVQRQANLRILFERARQFEKTTLKGLFNFVNFIHKLRTSSGDMGSAKILGENENVVRIMSIHKSKGLEFPVVIVAGTGKNFNLQDLNKAILYHQELGLGPNYVDAEKRITFETAVKQALKRKIKLESLSEEMRILYVALTRAKEKLIITGAVNNLSAAMSRWGSGKGIGDKVPEFLILKGKNFFDWIMPALSKHKDGEIIRSFSEKESGANNSFIDDGSTWFIKLWKKDDLNEAENSHNLEEIEIEGIEENKAEVDFARLENPYKEDKDNISSEYFNEVNRRLNWEYPFKDAWRIPAKVSVTELKRLGNFLFSDEYTEKIFVPPLIKKPSFLEELKAPSGAEKGIIMHSIMQRIDLKHISAEEIKSQIMEMVSKELLTDKQAQMANIPTIVKFFKSELGKRMINAEYIKRELPFTIRLQGEEAFMDINDIKYKDNTVLLQGVIDCYFKEEDGIVLIDYKTDYVTENNKNDIKDRYRKQIQYYTMAIERLSGEKVKEKYIYLFGNGDVIQY